MARMLRFALAALIVLAMRNPAQEPEPSEAPLPGSRAPEVEAKPVIRFGVISRYHPVVMYEEYQPMMQYLTSETPYRFELKLGKTYEDAVNYLGQGDVQIASLGAVTYIEAHSQFGGVADLFASVLGYAFVLFLADLFEVGLQK